VLEIGAGGQIAAAIEYAKTAYADALGLTIDRLNAQQTKAIHDLSTQVSFLEHHATQELEKIANRGALAGLALPMSNTFPQLGWFTPTYTVAGGDNVRIEMFGNFFDAGRTNYRPSIQIAGKTYEPTENGTLKLTFTVPASVLQAAPDKLVFVAGVLTVPYREHFAIVIPQKKKAEFRFQVTVLPKNAGKIVFTTDRTEIRRQTKQNHSPPFKQESTHDDIPDPIGSGKVWSSQASPGWYVDPTSVHLKVAWAEGDWHDFGNRSNIANAAWSIATVHHGLGTSGKVHFELNWTEYRHEPIHVPAMTAANLEWGSSRSFTVPSGGSWTAKYTQFDGKEFDVNSPAFKNAYVRVHTSGDNVTIVTVP
jgi:hypothetical protein